jgi:hypothetical protein
MEERRPATGGCLCGAVRYQINTPLASARACHCSRCRKQSESNDSATATLAPSFQVSGFIERPARTLSTTARQRCSCHCHGSSSSVAGVAGVCAGLLAMAGSHTVGWTDLQHNRVSHDPMAVRRPPVMTCRHQRRGFARKSTPPHHWRRTARRPRCPRACRAACCECVRPGAPGPLDRSSATA